MKENERSLIVLGGGGHARVLIDELRSAGRRVLGITDAALEVGATLAGLKVLGDDEYIFRIPEDEIELINGVGALPGQKARWRLASRMKKRGYQFSSVISNTACISEDVNFQDGVQVMAGAIVQGGAVVGANTVINTAAIVDHDCIIGDNSWLSPGVTICGNVRIASGVYIGAGSIVIQDVSIGPDVVVGAGSVIKESIQRATKITQHS